MRLFRATLVNSSPLCRLTACRPTLTVTDWSSPERIARSMPLGGACNQLHTMASVWRALVAARFELGPCFSVGATLHLQECTPRCVTECSPGCDAPTRVRTLLCALELSTSHCT